MDSRLVGRDAEVAEIWAFLSAASGGPAALAITGDAGIGKTIVWERALQDAGRSFRVLSCQPAPAERPLAFSALDDLFGDVAEEVLPALPGPRRHAVELALLHDVSPGDLPTGLSGGWSAATGATGAGARNSGRAADSFRQHTACHSGRRCPMARPVLGIRARILLPSPSPRVCLHRGDLPYRRCHPARPEPRPVSGSAGPCATGPAEPRRYRRDPAVPAGDCAAQVRAHAAL